MNISANCDKCGSNLLRVVYKLENRNTHFMYRDFFCFDCGFPSKLKYYFNDVDHQYTYYVSYMKQHDIEISFKQFTNIIINQIKKRVVETVLKDEHGNPIKSWNGYAEQEIYQFLRW